MPAGIWDRGRLGARGGQGGGTCQEARLELCPKSSSFHSFPSGNRTEEMRAPRGP